MASFDYDEIAEIADEILEEFGQECSAETTINHEWSPETGGGGSETVVTGGLCLFDNLSYGYKQSTPPNLIEAGDVMIIASASLDLKVGSVIICNGERWQVIDPRPVKPENVICVYEAHARRLV